MLLSIVYIALLLPLVVAFSPARYGSQRSAFSLTALPPSDSEDPNYLAHLPAMLKKGLDSSRPSPDVGKDLRGRYKTIETTKRKASAVLKTSNPELAAELEEIADELKETNEKFVQVALVWDAWNRPDPSLPKQLRRKYDEMQKDLEDPNFAAHVNKFMEKGNDKKRPDPELPSELRMMKYKSAAGVKRLAATELRKTKTSENVALAEELEDMADEIDESHERFEVIARAMRKAREAYEATSKNQEI
jgi:hypothetical protein